MYREFDRYDIANFIAIDFYKKRGFNLPEIKDLMEKTNHTYSSSALGKKVVEIEESIANQQNILERLKRTKKFYEHARTMQGKFEIRDFPLYSVLKTFDDRCDISNYGDNIFSKLDGEDILSSTVRAISLDRTGYKGSKICIIKKAKGDRQNSQEQFLESGKCLYTAGIANASFDENMLLTAHKWLDEHGFETKGIAYYFVDLCSVFLEEKMKQEFYWEKRRGKNFMSYGPR